jgi:hypothetical protein
VKIDSICHVALQMIRRSPGGLQFPTNLEAMAFVPLPSLPEKWEYEVEEQFLPFHSNRKSSLVLHLATRSSQTIGRPSGQL